MTQHSAHAKLVSPSSQSSAWAIRLLLAALLAFGSEILLWTTPTARSPIDWALLALGYPALSALLLEIAARYRLRDLYGLLTLAGVYGMINGLILNPQSALIGFPRTLITRAMGGHALVGLIALALFLAMNRLRGRTLLVALVSALIVGAAWGAWAHWSPQVLADQDASPPGMLLLYGGIGVGLIALALAFSRRSPAEPLDLRLNPAEWGFVLIVLLGLLVIHLLQGSIDPLSLIVIVTLSGFSVMILWFQMRSKGVTLLDGLEKPPSWIGFAALAAGFAAAGAVGYLLPRGDANSDPLALISALFTAYGLIWLPAVSIVLGARAFSRQARAMRL